MIEGAEAVTTAALSLALDAATLRHKAIAANIANAHTAGYVPLRLNFESQFDEARRSLVSHGQVDPFSLAAVRLELEPARDADGTAQPVRLDAEMAALAQNTVHYQALAKALSRHLAILASAVSEGKK